MKLKLITALLLASSLLAACSGNSQDQVAAEKEKPSNVKEMVSDYSARKLKAENASITSQQLIVTDKSGKETSYDLPKDDFFVSIAPYTNQTHP